MHPFTGEPALMGNWSGGSEGGYVHAAAHDASNTPHARFCPSPVSRQIADLRPGSPTICTSRNLPQRHGAGFSIHVTMFGLLGHFSAFATGLGLLLLATSSHAGREEQDTRALYEARQGPLACPLVKVAPSNFSVYHQTKEPDHSLPRLSLLGGLRRKHRNPTVNNRTCSSSFDSWAIPSSTLAVSSKVRLLRLNRWCGQQ